jgi:hypothetical protein
MTAMRTEDYVARKMEYLRQVIRNWHGTSGLAIVEAEWAKMEEEREVRQKAERSEENG